MKHAMLRYLVGICCLFIVRAACGQGGWVTKSSQGFTARSSPAGAEVNGIIYVIGGSGPLSTNEAYDPVTDTWSTKSSTGFTARGGHAVVAVNGVIYALGGEGPNN